MTGVRAHIRRLQSGFVLTVVGALLLLSVATGEARAATVTPPPSGDDDDASHDGLAFIGLDEGCQGYFGYGKFVVDLGDPLDDVGDNSLADAVLDGFAIGVDGVEVLAVIVLSRSFGANIDGVLGLFPEFEVFGATSSSTEVLLGGVFLDLVGCELSVDDLEDFRPRDSVPATITADSGSGFDLNWGGRVTFGYWEGDVGDPDGADLDRLGDSRKFTLYRSWADGDRFDPEACHEWALGVGDRRHELDEELRAQTEFASARTIIELGSPPADCPRATPRATAVPVNALALACAPTVVTVGQSVTCDVSGGDPDGSILWNASASPAFAGAGVSLGADGQGRFMFVVPKSALGRQITVELIEWDRRAFVQVAGSPLVPTSVPAGEGNGPIGSLLIAGAALLSIVVVRSRRGRGAVGHEG